MKNREGWLEDNKKRSSKVKSGSSGRNLEQSDQPHEGLGNLRERMIEVTNSLKGTVGGQRRLWGRIRLVKGEVEWEEGNKTDLCTDPLIQLQKLKGTMGSGEALGYHSQVLPPRILLISQCLLPTPKSRESVFLTSTSS